MDWLADIAKIAPEQRTRKQWAVMGQHHAQALVARHLPQMWKDEWAVYRLAVIVGAKHEYFRLALTREAAYWAAFTSYLENAPASKSHLGPLVLRVVGSAA